jgi:plastocyanin
MPHRTVLIALASGALLVAGCGAKREVTASTTQAPPPPTVTATASPTATPSPSPTATPTATPKPAAAGPKIAVAADPSGQLKFTQTALTAKAGNTTIDFTNKAPVPHNVAIRKDGGQPLVETKTISAGTTTSNVKLAAGTYEYYCTVPGHEQAGMKGTLTVK